jgi:hypothetical protein
LSHPRRGMNAISAAISATIPINAEIAFIESHLETESR